MSDRPTQPSARARSGRSPRRRLVAIGAAIGTAATMLAQGTAASPQPDPRHAHAAVIPGTPCSAFPADNWWNTSVESLPAHERSAAWMSNMQSDRDLHPDFGPAFGEEPVDYGIPITVVDSTHPKVQVDFDFNEDSDRVGYPLGDDTLIEGGTDRHTVIVDKDSCRLWETWATDRSGNTWSAGSGATWDLRSNALRPDGWTSADAAGLPILPGLLRYDEIASGSINHAIRFTTPVTDRSYLWPARHHAGAENDPNFPPMGARFRLRASFPISQFSAQAQVVLRAMKTYGMVLADNGGAWFFQGERDQRWADKLDLLDEFKDIPARAFEAVDTSSLMIDRNSMAARQPGATPVPSPTPPGQVQVGRVRGLKVAGAPTFSRRVVSWQEPAQQARILRYDLRVRARGTKKRRPIEKLTAQARSRRAVLRRTRLRAGKNVVMVRAVTAAGAGPWARQSFRVVK